MMRVTFENELFIVIDDFLPEELFAEFWVYIQSENFEFVHSRAWVTAFSLNDGIPLWAPPVISHKREGHSHTPVFPTGSAFDIFISALRGVSIDFERLIGNFGIDWDFFYSRIYLYPRDVGLSWHTDGKYQISGAYVFYAHPQWKASWGAELQINSVVSANLEYPPNNIGPGTSKKVSFHLDNTPIERELENPGFGYFVLPKPNRLVLLRNQLLHQIKKVDPSAGNNVRCSVSGFFMNNEKIAQIKESHSEKH